MNFYTSLFTGTIILLVVLLIIIGYLMSLSRKNETYPPSLKECPDYYSLDVSGVCKIGSNIYSNDISCNSEKFTKDQYKKDGTGPTSGLCAKKLWAIKCGVTWDGVTNNDNLCYVDYVKPYS
jgi:hypothetical protein